MSQHTVCFLSKPYPLPIIITVFKSPKFRPLTNPVSLHSYSVVVNGAVTRSGGTSAASPVFAAIIALVNDALLKDGKPVLGFLNPFLYSNGLSGLTDITGGGSVGCNGINGQTGQPVPGASIIPFASWNSTVGWDPVTGLGTPNFMKLKMAALDA